MAHYAAIQDKVLCDGGPEEGGWHYDRYFPRKVYKGKKRIAKKWFKRFAAQAQAENAARRWGYSSVSGGEWTVATLTRWCPRDTGPRYYC